jgi:hypothetical protein|tara:strand:- start:211 stop:357 length:147 start_codon:yes stop_codon:yes gene_type:complete
VLVLVLNTVVVAVDVLNVVTVAVVVLNVVDVVYSVFVLLLSKVVVLVL